MTQLDLQPSLFDDSPDWREDIDTGVVVLRGFALSQADVLAQAVHAIAAQAPFRQMHTPSGLHMSVALTGCGEAGWVSDAHGYRYARRDPDTGLPWPAMPDTLRNFAAEAAATAGFRNFVPDACLINRYAIGARMSLHQDKNERDFSQPIVSVSLGLPAVFQFGGLARADKAQRIPLAHGDVVVWGGPARMRFHGVLPVKPGVHPQWGEFRINLTFRKAL
ncbi:alkylated DNA repair protein (DNA oxidative demethylase) [Andreprevotia lacus DSM 23236]|jgi:alkylated DNA repair protein (DNA oxidative demethylase)|uniref:Alkylated DNA repair protein (DNA oxidative demethylase) n=1 Tax=Andreprevotia lacus DSM 23236 TaxID=1121001 RepID=A0A1W1XII3_9NEIS|nr:DNA oxidative demethylase AlkB [Andreprevotia lacus]SMC23783.1 alkylated DNA repair protein (DNA oxidative demethylase) [Andreprevotia lacus DSM 23236]